jgi:hypothetical protein
MSGKWRVLMASDSDPLARYQEFHISGACEVIRTVDVVIDEEQYRLEVTQSVSNRSPPFDVRCYHFERVDEKKAAEDTYAHVFRRGFPFASSKTADSALTSALSDLQAWNSRVRGAE